MTDIIRLRTGYTNSVALIRTGFSGPPGADGGGAYDDTAILARVSNVEQSIAALEGASVAWTDITNKPATFPAMSHNHEISAVTGLQVALDGKQPVTSFKTVNGTAITGIGNIDIPAGADGAPGPAGPVGPQGPIGPQGLAGPQGPAGLDGVDGVQGPVGPIGPQGPVGADGAQGAIGPQGPAGVDGADGAIGPQGPQGPAGPAGPDGAQGLAGSSVTVRTYTVLADAQAAQITYPNDIIVLKNP